MLTPYLRYLLLQHWEITNNENKQYITAKLLLPLHFFHGQANAYMIFILGNIVFFDSNDACISVARYA
ncbi:MAG: hypothetical protein A3I66_00390 [Burkholderiales bacterium RIFCSPLOWO2_02_FULL_57_36]|nr:MAG: hypothetical protein A3I66_00390 [Burkholderiales bacterium RIFCSPLOWO2_02_FULL_57_36]